MPETLRARGEPVRIAYVGSGYRIDEFRSIWDALLRISKEYGSQVEFEFWGLDISSLPRLSSPTTSRPYTFSYPLYLRNLQAARFDVLLIPLFETPRPRLAKALIKYYETAAACALGIFSDVVQYRLLPGDLTCLKVVNDTQSWYNGLKRAIEMPDVEFDLLRRRCIEHVREEFTTSAQIDLHEAALRAIEFHGHTRGQRASDGRPRLLYVMHSVNYGGAEIQLMRRWKIAQRYGIQPVVLVPAVFKDTEEGRKFKSTLELEGIPMETAVYSCFTEPRSPSEYDNEIERDQIKQVIKRIQPALVHSITFIPSLGQVCQEFDLPLVSTLYQIDEEFSWSDGRPNFRHCAVVQSDSLYYASRWADLLDAPKVVGRIGAQGSFNIGQNRYLQALQADGSLRPLPSNPVPVMLVLGTFQPRKQQLETIHAAALLKKEGHRFQIHMYGYTKFYPEYMENCYRTIQHKDLEDSVFIHDFVDDEDSLLVKAEMLLSLSNFESFPGSIQGALAAGVLVVATPAGGVRELITDNETGILCPGMEVEALVDGLRRALRLTPVERMRIVEQGRKVARLELHPLRAANDLFRMYNLALDEVSRTRPATVAPLSVSTVVIPDKNLTDRGRVKQPAGLPLSLMPIGAGLTYRVQADYDGWMGLDLLVELFSNPAPGVMELKVFTPQGALLRQVSLDVTSLKTGGSWCEFRFDQPVQNAAGRAFRLELTLRGAGGAVFSVRQSSMPIRRELRLLNRILRKLGFRLAGGVPYARMWYAR